MREMADSMALDLVDKGLVTDQMVLTIGYDIENLADPVIRSSYHGSIITDQYGRSIPKPAHGSINLKYQTSSTKLIVEAVMELFNRIMDKNLLIRRINLTANRVVPESSIQNANRSEQLDLFTDYDVQQQKRAKEHANLEREKRAQKALLDIKKKFGKNAVLKGMSLMNGATIIERNKLIGGHKE